MLFRIAWSGWIVLIKSEILIMTGMVWPVSSDKWKAPLLPYAARNGTFSQRASSPIWASEASRSRTRRRAARSQGTVPRFRVSSRASNFLDIPQMESLLAGYWTFSLKI